MIVVDLQKGVPEVLELLRLARTEPVLVVTIDGEEFVVTEADDFEREVALLRDSEVFQRFLAERAAGDQYFSIDEIEQNLAQDPEQESGDAPGRGDRQ